MTDDNVKGKPLARPGKPRVRQVKKLSSLPQPITEAGYQRKSQRVKIDGWRKGITRSSCFYVQSHYHQAVNVAASSMKVSKGVLVERALREYLANCPDLEVLWPALAGILGADWPEPT